MLVKFLIVYTISYAIGFSVVFGYRLIKRNRDYKKYEQMNALKSVYEVETKGELDKDDLLDIEAMFEKMMIKKDEEEL